MTFLTGMSLCFISTYNQSFALMTLGKTFHQIGSEMIGVGMSNVKQLLILLKNIFLSHEKYPQKND